MWDVDKWFTWRLLLEEELNVSHVNHSPEDRAQWCLSTCTDAAMSWGCPESEALTTIAQKWLGLVHSAVPA
jgi:hypothetical protein